MKGRKVLLTALNAVIFIYFASAADSNLISPFSYLPELLNVTIEEIKNIVDQLKFRTDVSAHDLSIIQYLPNGTTIPFILSDLISGSNTVDLDINELTFIIHGYLNTGQAVWIEDMVKAYHTVNITNTFAVDWAKTAKRNYIASANATKNVGELVGKWLFDFQATKNFSFDQVHLVGHSLGAHVAGFIAKTICNKTGGTKLGRISGLDVAAPLFEYPIKADDSNRLSDTDADLVEAYHTNKGILGFLKPVGSQDFYINNGGPIQPFCNNINVIDAFNCSHGFSHKFFTKSIENNMYTARACEYGIGLFNRLSCSNNQIVIMGQNNNGTDIPGVFYGNTDNSGNPRAIE
ncbi:lipase member H-like [Euwallacea fornicatus]|uniref:lipase member H-like n=1 Tax=Euwallacea fornicatus TaxID=995702 RepID=UPI00338F7D4F